MIDSNSGSPIEPSQNPAPPPKKGGKRKILIAGLLVAFAIGFKTVANVGVGFGLAEIDIRKAKYEAWPQEFKTSFMDGCVESTAEAIKQKNYVPDMNVVQNYCGCVVERVEAAHVVDVKYNRLTETEESMAKKMSAQVEAYVASAEGDKATDECMGKATEVAAKKPAEGGNRQPASAN